MTLNLLGIAGALTAQAIFFISILIFAARLARRERLAYWLGIPQLLTGVVLIYLMLQGPANEQSGLFYLGSGLMLSWLLVKLVVVYILRLEFGHTRWVIPYLLLFFLGTAGMVAVSAQAGIFWLIFSIIIYLHVVAIALFQRYRADVGRKEE